MLRVFQGFSKNKHVAENLKKNNEDNCKLTIIFFVNSQKPRKGVKQSYQKS